MSNSGNIGHYVHVPASSRASDFAFVRKNKKKEWIPKGPPLWWKRHGKDRQLTHFMTTALKMRLFDHPQPEDIHYFISKGADPSSALVRLPHIKSTSITIPPDPGFLVTDDLFDDLLVLALLWHQEDVSKLMERICFECADFSSYLKSSSSFHRIGRKRAASEDLKTRPEASDVMKSLLPFIAISNVPESVQVFQMCVKDGVVDSIMHERDRAELILKMIQTRSSHRAHEKLKYVLPRTPWSVCVEFIKLYGCDAFSSESEREMARLFVRRFVPDLVMRSGDQDTSSSSYDVFRFLLMISVRYTLHRELRMLLAGCQYEKHRWKCNMELKREMKDIFMNHAMNLFSWGSSYKSLISLLVESSLLSWDDVNHNGVLFANGLLDECLNGGVCRPKMLQASNVYGLLCFLAMHSSVNGKYPTLLKNISRFYELVLMPPRRSTESKYISLWMSLSKEDKESQSFSRGVIEAMSSAERKIMERMERGAAYPDGTGYQRLRNRWTKRHSVCI